MNLNRYSRRFIKGLFTMALISMSTVACSDKKSTEEVTEATEEKPEEGGLHFTSEQIAALGIQFGTVEKKNLTAVIKASGTLEVPPQNSALISVLSGGLVKKISVMEGQQISKGTNLITIESQELLKLQQDYLTSKGGFSFVSAEYDRQKQLQAAGAGTGKSFQLAEANYTSERSKISALESQLRQFGISTKSLGSGAISSQYNISAPINGTVGTITAQTGSFAQPGTSLMQIVDNSKIHADLVVFEKDLADISIGQTITFQLTNQLNTQIEGKIYGINKSFEGDSKGVIVHAVINKPSKNLIPGMYVTGLINKGTELVSAVPVDAVVHAEGKDYIFIVKDAGQEQKTSFEKVEVSKGVTELGYVQVTPLKKLADHTKVVIKGAFYLESKSAGPGEE